MTEINAETRRSGSPELVVARDPAGLWLVSDRDERCGGSFRNRRDAVRFALEESERRHEPVTILPEADASALGPGRRAA